MTAMNALTADRVAGLLLAAGAGARLGQAKALVEVEGRFLVERGIDLLVEGGCDPCVVVLGARADEVQATADLSDAAVVVAGAWARGQAASVRAGLTHLERTTTGQAGGGAEAVSGGASVAAVVIALVDQPLITPAAVRRLIRAWRDGAVAAVACEAGRPRNPVLLDRQLWPAVMADLRGDRGAGPWLRRHPDVVTHVEVGDVADTVDVDTREDLEAVRERLHPL